MVANVVSMLLVGDSHISRYKPLEVEFNNSPLGPTTAFLKPVHVLGAYGVLDLIVTYEDGRKALNPAVEHAISAWPGLDVKGKPLAPGAKAHKHLLLSIGTSAHACDPTVAYPNRNNHRLFFKGGVDFVLHDRPDLPIDHSCSLLPEALIQDLFEDMIAPLKAALSYLAPQYPERLWLVGSPPPPGDNVIKQKHVMAKFSGGSPSDVFLAPPLVTLKTWLLVNRLVAEICHETGCRFIDCTPVACDEAGFLKKEFEFDGFHANDRYNDLMATHVSSTVLTSLRPSDDGTSKA